MLTTIYRTWPNKGTRLVFEFFGGSNDFIMQKVYLLRLMPVCVGLNWLAPYFCQSPQLQVEYN
jgi:hypothetical protein